MSRRQRPELRWEHHDGAGAAATEGRRWEPREGTSGPLGPGVHQSEAVTHGLGTVECPSLEKLTAPQVGCPGRGSSICRRAPNWLAHLIRSGLALSPLSNQVGLDRGRRPAWVPGSGLRPDTESLFERRSTLNLFKCSQTH